MTKFKIVITFVWNMNYYSVNASQCMLCVTYSVSFSDFSYMMMINICVTSKYQNWMFLCWNIVSTHSRKYFYRHIRRYVMSFLISLLVFCSSNLWESHTLQETAFIPYNVDSFFDCYYFFWGGGGGGSFCWSKTRKSDQ